MELPHLQDYFVSVYDIFIRERICFKTNSIQDTYLFRKAVRFYHKNFLNKGGHKDGNIKIYKKAKNHHKNLRGCPGNNTGEEQCQNQPHLAKYSPHISRPMRC